MAYYDWRAALSYDADVTMVVASRGSGKTFGLRVQLLRDWLRDGSRFVAVTRTRQKELPAMASGFFDRVGALPDFEGWLFRSDSSGAYAARKPEDDSVKPKWERVGYFVALTEMQTTKQMTFDRVYRIVFDEAVIDKRLTPYSRYLPNEFEILANVVDSCSRERPDSGGRSPRVYLLGNACDMTNPYFVRYGVDSVPEYGRHWYAGKTFLLDYVEPSGYEDAKRSDTVAGRMLAGTVGADVASGNVFVDSGSDFVADRPKWSTFEFGVVFEGARYGVWYDAASGLYYVCSVFPKKSKRPVFALTREDDSVDRLVALRSNAMLKSFASLYQYGIIRYESLAVREGFLRVLSLFGIR